MTEQHAQWLEILEEAKNYPSPHNSQPIKVRIISDTSAEVFYDLDRGLPAENFGIPFGHVCAGVFLEGLSAVAGEYGFEVVETLANKDMDFSSKDRLHPIARISLVPKEPTQEDVMMHLAFNNRQTSRRPYSKELVTSEIINPLKAIAEETGQTFTVLQDAHKVDEIIRVNQETLFLDLQNDAVHDEIMHWLRFSRKEAEVKSDGLSAETMLLPGNILRFAMGRRDLWEKPVLGKILKKIYLRTMAGVSQVAWLEGKFEGPEDYVRSGKTFMKIWLNLTLRNVYLHPFGTVITNPVSHKKFVELAGINEEPNGKHMAWMLFRLGYSKKPPVAFKRPLEEMLIK